MVSGKKIGKLVQKYYMRVEPVPGGALEKTQSLKRWSGRSGYWDEDDDAPADVPEGCLAVYVGPEKRRFVIQTGFLYKRVFRELLRKSEEEYGFETAGGLRIACEAGLFEKLLWKLETGRNADESF
jgi:hypothetical protein